MKEIKSILCPVDFSPGSEKAATHAAALAEAVGAELHLMHAYQLPLYALPDGGLVAGPEFVEQVSSTAQTSLDALAAELGREKLDITTHVTDGVPHLEIVRMAESVEANLIVMGTHGRTGIRHMVMGSIAERVVRTAPQPVLTVRLGHEEDARGTHEAFDGGIRRILVAYDFSDPARRAMETAHRLRAHIHCAVEVLFVLDDPFSENPGMPKESIWAAEQELEAHEAALRTVIGRTVSEVFGADAQTIPVNVVRGGAVQSILATADESKASMLIIGTTGKGGIERLLMGSVSQKLLQTSHVPVLTVH